MNPLFHIFEDGSEIDRYIVAVYVVPRLSSLCSSLEQETLVNAGHVAPRFLGATNMALAEELVKC